MERQKNRRNGKRKTSNLRKNYNDYNYWATLVDLSNELSYTRGVQDGCDRTNDRWIAVTAVVLAIVETAIIVGEALLRVFITGYTDKNSHFARCETSDKGFFYHSF